MRKFWSWFSSILVSLVVVPGPFRQTAMNVTAAGLLAALSLVISITQAIPAVAVWIYQTFRVTAGGAPGLIPARVAAAYRAWRRTMIWIGWFIIAEILLLAAGIRFHNTDVLVAVFIVNGIIAYLFFRAVNLAPGTWVWGLAGRARDGLGTLVLTFFFLAIVALAAHDLLDALTPSMYLLLVLLAMVLSSSGILLGTHGTFGTKFMKWASVALVLAVILPRVFGWSTSPVLASARQLVSAFQDSGRVKLLNAAKHVEPGVPADLATINRETQKKIVADAIARYETRARQLQHISGTRELTGGEKKELKETTEKIMQLQQELHNLDRPVSTAATRTATPKVANEAMTTGKVLTRAGLFVVEFNPDESVKNAWAKWSSNGQKHILEIGAEFKTWEAKPPVFVLGEPCYEIVLPDENGDYVLQAVRSERLFIAARKVRLNDSSLATASTTTGAAAPSGSGPTPKPKVTAHFELSGFEILDTGFGAVVGDQILADTAVPRGTLTVRIGKRQEESVNMGKTKLTAKEQGNLILKNNSQSPVRITFYVYDGAVPIPDTPERGMSSMAPQVVLTFLNDKKMSVTANWTDDLGGEHLYQVVPPGESRTQPSFANATWVFRVVDSGAYVKTIVAPPHDATIQIY